MSTIKLSSRYTIVENLLAALDDKTKAALILNLDDLALVQQALILHSQEIDEKSAEAKTLADDIAKLIDSINGRN